MDGASDTDPTGGWPGDAPSAEALIEVFDAAAAGILVCDSDDRVRYCNRAFNTYWQYHELDVYQGMPVRDLIRQMGQKDPNIVGGVPFDDWLRDRLEEHREANARGRIIRFPQGWLMLRVYRLPSGGTASVYTPFTRLQKSEDRLRRQGLILDQLFDAVLVADSDGIVIEANAAAATLFQKNADELIGSRFFDALEEGTEQDRVKVAFEGLSETDSWSGEVGVLAGDDEARVCEITLSVLEGEQSDADDPAEASITVVARDITARRRAEDELRTQNALFELVMDSVPAMINYFDADKRLQFVNQSYADFFGVSREDIAAGAPPLDKLEDAIDPDKWDEWRADMHQLVERAMTGERVEFEGPRYLRDGRTAHVLGTIVPQSDSAGAVVGCCAMMVDDTERHRSQQALQESEALFRRMIEILPDAVRVHTRDHVVYANPAAVRMYGATSPDDLIGQPGESFAADDERDDLMSRRHQVYEGRPIDWEERTARRLDGTSVPTEVNAVPIVWEGAPSAMVINRDVSARKEVEDLLKAAKEEAENAARSKSRFLAAASHDLAQPLHALRLLSEALSVTDLDEEAGELTRQMRLAIGSMEGLINALIEISRLEAGVVNPDISPFPVQDVFDQLHAAFDGPSKADGTDLRIVPSSLSVKSDFRLLSRAVQNLVANAVRYAAGGKVVLGVRRRGDFVDFVIRDNGPGIPEDMTEEIFEAFRQLPDPTRDRSEGIGLGLAIVRRISELLDIEVRLDPGEGRGAAFVLTVPHADEAPLRRGMDEFYRTVPNNLDGRSILVVEDEQSVADATARILQSWGARVMVADCHAAALNCLDTGDAPPDLIMADFSLSDSETGLDVIDALRKKLESKIPAVVVTAAPTADVWDSVAKAGLPMLQKPVRPAQLRATLSHLLSA